MSVTLPFARRVSDGRLVDITAIVVNGKGCGCVCPSCGATVIAKTRGAIKAPHFAHAAECTSALETALHEAAKQIIRELGFVWLPDPLVSRQVRFSFTAHTLETRFDRVIPDVMVWQDPARRLAIEIFVTHAVDAEKLAKLRERRLACIEYDLSGLPRLLTYDALREMFASGSVPARWIYNERIPHPPEPPPAEDSRMQENLSRAAAYEGSLLAAAHRQAAYRRFTPAGGVAGVVYAVRCPLHIGQSHAADADDWLTTVDHCRRCKLAREAPRVIDGRPSFVWCGGVAEQAREVLRISTWHRTEAIPPAS